MLDLVDVFDQAMQQTRNAKDLQTVVQGIGFLHKNFSDFLRTEGLQPLEVVGKDFDPHLSEAVEQVEVDSEYVGKVLSEVQRGYIFQGRILRPSRVRVGVARKSTEAPNNLSATTAEDGHSF